MINFLQVPPVEPQPGFMQQYSFIIMIGLMVLVLWLFMWRPESKRRKQMQAFRERPEKRRQGHHRRRHLRHGEGDQGDHPADRGGRQRHAAHRQEHGRSRQQRPSAPVNNLFQIIKKLQKFAAFLFAGSNILFYICIPVRKTRAQSQQHCRGGGGISKRLLQITSFSAMFFYVRMSANDPAGILAQIRSRPARRSPENSGQKILNAQTRQQMQPVLSLYLHPDSSTHTHDPTHILPYPRHLLPADRHRTGRRHHPQCDVHGRLPRQHAGHSGTRARHESRRRRSPGWKASTAAARALRAPTSWPKP